ncbi:magnesium transporter [Thermococcus sp.]|uniref:magnesium transporter n=1 Tax=Thermococcus sp. TaxID=35749 RepID=UPI002607BD3A|nr:magnesium transporter [Thermococcus sp.]
MELKDKVRNAFTVSLPSLVTSLVIGFFGGTFLGKYLNMTKRDYPGILVILPGMMGLRGNVFSSMASRFSTMLYIGDLEPSLKEKKVLKNVVIAMLLSLIPITFLWAVGVLEGARLHAIEVFFAVIGSTILISVLLGYFTASVTIVSFRRDIDPDSVAIPLIANNSDIFGTLYVVLIAKLMVGA